MERTLGQTRTEKTRNLLDEGFGEQEGVVFFGQLLHELLVLVQPRKVDQQLIGCA